LFIEEYPIQDNSYEPVRFIDCNVVNKAIQRGKAKVASRATGIGLKLYEGQDLQFDGKESKGPELPKKPVAKTAAQVKAETSPTGTAVVEGKPPNVTVVQTPTGSVKVEQITMEEPGQVANNATKEEVNNFIKLMESLPKLALHATLSNFNKALIKKYQFTLSVEDLDNKPELIAKLSQITSLARFQEAIENQYKKEEK
jgi:hypothetical protein